VIATGIFLVHARELFLWTWAHRSRYRWYRPTELMTWTVMQRAMALGCNTFDLMGGGDFKRKFGAEPELTKYRWVWSRYPWITRARDVAGVAHRWQQSLRGRLLRLALRSTGAFAAASPTPPAPRPPTPSRVRVNGAAAAGVCDGRHGPGAAARAGRYSLRRSRAPRCAHSLHPLRSPRPRLGGRLGRSRGTSGRAGALRRSTT